LWSGPHSSREIAIGLHILGPNSLEAFGGLQESVKVFSKPPFIPTTPLTTALAETALKKA